MSKTRVYELARELQLESKALVTQLKALGISVASHQSTLTDQQIQAIRRSLEGGTAEPKSTSSPKVIRRRRAAPTDDAGDHADDDADGKADLSQSVADEQTLGAESEKAGATAQDVSSSRTVTTEADGSQKNRAPSHEEVRALGLTPLINKPAPRPEIPSSRADATDQTEDNSEQHPASDASQEASPGVAESATLEDTNTLSSTAKGGATIVRRATPSEVADSKAAAQKQSDQRRFGNNKRPAASGGRPEGERPRPPRGGFESTEADPSWSLVESGAEGAIRSKVKNRVTPFREEEVEPKKPVIVKVKREHLNVRSLLEMAQSSQDEDFPEAPDGRRKTVYTPSAQTRKRDLKRRKDLKKTKITTPRAAYRVVRMSDDISVGELGRQLGVKGGELIKKLMNQGMMVTINQTIDFDTASLIASEYGYETTTNKVSVDDIIAKGRRLEDGRPLAPRAPIVTIMGHVDHGKTSILDAIRKARVAEGESGGITQHIGAYSVTTKSGQIVSFLDTPGHEAFSAMRQRGARVTDIIVLVVAADDGVKPQTVEAISHAKAANVPMIVAINKVDKPGANFDRIFNELMEHGIQSEEWGGDTQFVKVSALKGTGLDELLESISLQAEVLELRAHQTGEASGVVVEAHLDPSRGPVATVMVQDGLASIGDVVVAGSTYGKIRAMIRDDGSRVESAGPSIPVEITGLESVPMAGDPVHVVGSEKIAKDITSLRRVEEAHAAGTKTGAATLENWLGKVADGDRPEVPLILKGDTQGSIEAMAQSLSKLNSDRVENRVVHKGVGGITESDVRLAATSNSVIIGFNVRLGRGLNDIAENGGVPIKYFSVIYDVVDAVKALMAGKLPPIQTEVVQGHAEVRQTIRVPKIGMVAGTAVLDGKIVRHSQLRLIRDDVVIFEGKVASLRRFKDDVKEVSTGYECGIGIEGCSDIKEGDVIEAYTIEESAATL